MVNSMLSILRNNAVIILTGLHNTLIIHTWKCVTLNIASLNEKCKSVKSGSTTENATVMFEQYQSYKNYIYQFSIATSSLGGFRFS